MVDCRMHHELRSPGSETVQVHVASNLRVVLSLVADAEPRPWRPDFLPRYQSTVGQLPLGTGGEFPVDQRRYFRHQQSGELHRHVLLQNRLQSEVPSNSDLERHSVAAQETEQWVGLCLVPVRFRTYKEQLKALTQVPTPQAQPSLVFLHWFHGDTSPSAELRSRRHLCNDRCPWSKQRLKP